jgi:hypothetical protein
MSYFVSPPDDRMIAFDVADFREKLGEWEGINIREPDSPGDIHALEWDLPIRVGDVYGALDSNGQIVHLDGFLGDCALFALWLRTIVPEKVELLFYDEAYSADVALLAITRESDLIRAFGT